MTQSFDCLVVGGGIVGLTAAVAMSKQGCSVAVIDAGSLSVDTGQADPRVFAINQASKELLQQLAVWPHMDETRIAPYQRMHVWDAATGAKIDFDSRMVALNQLGSIIEESIIKKALLLSIQGLNNIHLFPDSPVDSLINHGDCVTLGCRNQQWQGQLLIATDGAHSPTRDKLDVPLTSWPYHQHAIVARVAVTQEHQQTAWQVFHPHGPLAFLPLVHRHQCSIVWSTSPARAQALMRLPEAEFNRELTDAFFARLGEVKLLDKRYSFPLIMRHARQYSGSCWLLAGDAAHSIHPLAGLGLNLGLADVRCWLEKLEQNKSKLHFGKALAAYQRQRKSEVWKVIVVMDGLKTLFAHPFPLVKLARGIGLSGCNRLETLKRLFIHQAMGK